MPRILLVGTGGTISARGQHSLDWHNYATGTFTVDQLVDQVAELASAAHVNTVQVENFSSTDLTPRHWLHLRKLVVQRAADYDGIVITHGTSTLEETAWFLHLTLAMEKPVVLVGAQRPLTALGSDAKINLYHAVQTAAQPTSRGLGVLAVMNGEIHSAREVYKADTYQVNTLSSGALGPLGFIDVDGGVQYYRRPARRHTTSSEFARLTFAGQPGGAADGEEGVGAAHQVREQSTEFGDGVRSVVETSFPRVAVLFSHPGGGADLIRGAVSAEYDGIVMAAMGAGMLSQQEEKALRQAAQQGVAVVRSSRTGGGAVVPLQRYADTPFIAGGNLAPPKARILLMLALMADLPPPQIQRVFKEY